MRYRKGGIRVDPGDPEYRERPNQLTRAQGKGREKVRTEWELKEREFFINFLP